jgi:hypothetical protein
MSCATAIAIDRTDIVRSQQASLTNAIVGSCTFPMSTSQEAK